MSMGWEEMILISLRESMHIVRQTASKPVSCFIESKYNDIRAMSKNQLIKFYVDNKHNGQYERLRKGWYKGKDQDVFMSSKVTYARNRLAYAFDVNTRRIAP